MRCFTGEQQRNLVLAQDRFLGGAILLQTLQGTIVQHARLGSPGRLSSLTVAAKNTPIHLTLYCLLRPRRCFFSHFYTVARLTPSLFTKSFVQVNSNIFVLFTIGNTPPHHSF
jgi:hypothetical protein